MNGIVLICDGPGNSNLEMLNFNGPFGDYDGKAQQYIVPRVLQELWPLSKDNRSV